MAIPSTPNPADPVSPVSTPDPMSDPNKTMAPADAAAPVQPPQVAPQTMPSDAQPPDTVNMDTVVPAAAPTPTSTPVDPNVELKSGNGNIVEGETDPSTIQKEEGGNVSQDTAMNDELPDLLQDQKPAAQPTMDTPDPTVVSDTMQSDTKLAGVTPTTEMPVPATDNTEHKTIAAENLVPPPAEAPTEPMAESNAAPMQAVPAAAAQPAQNTQNAPKPKATSGGKSMMTRVLQVLAVVLVLAIMGVVALIVLG